jgi:glucose-6-phosphate isomerase
MIHQGLTFDFGILYVIPMGGSDIGPHLIWRILMTGQSTNIISEVERRLPSYQANLDRIIAAYFD